MQEGDEVVTLDGKPILSWTQDAVTALFENGAVGEKHALELMRDGKKRKVTVKLKEMI
ncbi:MAG: PDZ domain-containing protein [Candidatus Eiseniibacteriota bacterium]